MKGAVAAVNNLLVEVFNDILKIEEKAIRASGFNDLSVSEMHTIEAIGLDKMEAMSDVAKKLRVTVGTLTVAVSNLVKKSYVSRIRDEIDRRVVLVSLSEKGQKVYSAHQKFHIELVEGALNGLTEDERRILVKALGKIHVYFESMIKRNSI